jgi:hypothetical protein
VGGEGEKARVDFAIWRNTKNLSQECGHDDEKNIFYNSTTKVMNNVTDWQGGENEPVGRRGLWNSRSIPANTRGAKQG